MHTSIANSVHAVFNAGLALRERLEAGEQLPREVEREALKRLLSAFESPEPVALEAMDEFAFDFSESSSHEERSELTHATIHYALICWLDEWLHRYTAQGPRWRESTLEADLIGTDDGSRKFWDEARYAETRGDLDALEVMFLCVMLGFRGAWCDTPVQLDAWVTRIRAKLEQAAPTWTPPMGLEPPQYEAAYADNLAYRRMAFSVLLSLSLVLPMAVAAWWRM